MKLQEFLEFLLLCKVAKINTLGDLKNLKATDKNDLWRKVYDKKNKIAAE